MSNCRLHILLATHVGEPIGGITVANQHLLASSFSSQLDLHVLETSTGNYGFSARGSVTFRNLINSIVSISRFATILFRVRPDLVHIGTAHGASFAKHSFMTMIACVFCIPVVLELHCDISWLLPADRILWKRYVLFVLQRASALVTLSREWDILSREICESKVRKVHCVPNAIETSAYASLSRPRTIEQGTVALLFLGHIGREKGCFDLLTAVAELRYKTHVPFRLHFVGETLRAGEKEQLREVAAAQGLLSCVSIHNPEYGEQKLWRLGATDIFVLPSYHEGMPISVIEAMASGLPIVATRVGGMRDQVVYGETGFLFEPGDIDALVDILLRLIENKDERLVMGLKGRQRAVAHYNIETRAEQLISLYRELL